MQGLAVHVYQEQNEQNGERQGGADNQRGPPAHHHEQHAEHDQRRIAQIDGKPVQALLDIIALGKDDIDIEARRGSAETFHHALGLTAPAIHPPVRQDERPHKHRARAVEPGLCGVRLAPRALDSRDIAKAHKAPPLTSAQRHRADPFERIERAIHLDNEVIIVTGHPPGGRTCIRPRQQRSHLACRDAKGRRRFRIKHDADFLFRRAEKFRPVSCLQPAQPVFQLAREPPQRADTGIRAFGPRQGHDHARRAHIFAYHLRQRRLCRQARLRGGHLLADFRPCLLDLGGAEIFPDAKADRGDVGARDRCGLIYLGKFQQGALDTLGHERLDPLCIRARI